MFNAIFDEQEYYSLEMDKNEWENLKDKSIISKVILPCCNQPGYLRVSKNRTKHFVHLGGNCIMNKTKLSDITLIIVNMDKKYFDIISEVRMLLLPGTIDDKNDRLPGVQDDYYSNLFEVYKNTHINFNNMSRDEIIEKTGEFVTQAQIHLNEVEKIGNIIRGKNFTLLNNFVMNLKI